MSHPLPIASLGRGSYAASMDVGKTQSETRIPTAPTLRMITGDVTDIFYRSAEAGRANHCAIGASQAALSDTVPARMVKALIEKILDPVGVDATRLLVRGFSNPDFHLLKIFFAGWRYFDLSQYLGPVLTS